MVTKKILNFAQRSGYATIEYLGKYKEYDLYKPLYKDPHIATGLPVYIIVKEDKPEFVRGKGGLEIQKFRVQHKNPVQCSGQKTVKEGLIMTEEDKKFMEEQFNTIQKRLDALEKEMKALKKVTKSTEAKLDSIQEDLDGKFELLEADIANAEASIMDTIDECTNS